MVSIYIYYIACPAHYEKNQQQQKNQKSEAFWNRKKVTFFFTNINTYIQYCYITQQHEPQMERVFCCSIRKRHNKTKNPSYGHREFNPNPSHNSNPYYKHTCIINFVRFLLQFCSFLFILIWFYSFLYQFFFSIFFLIFSKKKNSNFLFFFFNFF